VTRLNILPSTSASGPAQMAADEVLFGIAPALRFYVWDRPTLSLGYFQPAAEAEQHAGVRALPLVRRSSGGAAILHGDGDLTYALALPADRSFHAGESWLCRVHHAIQAAFSAFGVRAEGVVCGAEQKLGPVLCFLHQTPADVLVGPHKVVGSAQRKNRGALLQHGTIRLRGSRYTPELPGVLELTGRNIAPGEFAACVARELCDCEGWTGVPAPSPPADPEVRAKYESDAWTRRR
jgi:lipoyl(octanoyl) transferase